MVFKNVELSCMLSQSIDSILPYEEHSIDSNVDSQSTSSEINAPALIGYDQSGRKIAVDVSKLATGEQKLSERWGVKDDEVEFTSKDSMFANLNLCIPLITNFLSSAFFYHRVIYQSMAMIPK